MWTAKTDQSGRMHKDPRFLNLPSEDSYQPGHLPILIRVFAVCSAHSDQSLCCVLIQGFFMQTAKTLISLSLH